MHEMWYTGSNSVHQWKKGCYNHSSWTIIRCFFCGFGNWVSCYVVLKGYSALSSHVTDNKVLGWEKKIWITEVILSFKRGSVFSFPFTYLIIQPMWMLNQAEVLWVEGVWQEGKIIIWPENIEWKKKRDTFVQMHPNCLFGSAGRISCSWLHVFHE